MIPETKNILYCVICMMITHSVFALKEKPKKITLSNGLTVYLLYDADLPYLKLELLTPLGSSKDPQSKEGLGYIVGQSLSRGTKSRSAQDISRGLEQLGSRFFAATTKDYSIFSAEALSWNTDALLDIFSDIIIHPLFDSKEVAFIKNQTLSQIEKQPESASSFAHNILTQILFKNSVYQHSVFGYKKSMMNIQDVNVKEHYKKYFQPHKSVLGVTGRYPKDIKKKIENFLGGWVSDSHTQQWFFKKWFVKKPTVLVPISIWQPAEDMPTKYTIVHRGRQVQSDIHIGFTSIPRSSEDFLAFQIANTALGGGIFSARLMDEIRENLGYTYTIRSSLSPLKQAGLFSIATPTRLDVTRKAVDRIRELLQEFHEKGITEEEMMNAKEYYRVSLMKILETPESRLSRRIVLEYMGVSYDFDRLQKKLNRISLSRIQKVIQKYFIPSGLTIIILSDYKKVRSQFKDIQKEVTIKKFDQFL